MLTLFDRFFSDKPFIFGRAPAAGTSLINISEFNQPIDLGVTFNIAYKLDISSSSVADTVLGTGAQVVQIAGLALDGTPLLEAVPLNGQTVVPTVNNFWRVFGAQVIQAGSGRKNAGDIYILKTGTGGAYAGGVPPTLTSAMIKILVGEMFGSSGFFTAPRGKQFLLSSWRAGARVQVGRFMVWIGAERALPSVLPPTMMLGIDVPVGVPVPVDCSCGVYLNEQEDLYFRSQMGAAAGVASFLASLVKV